MARPLRIEYANALCHATSRGSARWESPVIGDEHAVPGCGEIRGPRVRFALGEPSAATASGLRQGSSQAGAQPEPVVVEATAGKRRRLLNTQGRPIVRWRECPAPNKPPRTEHAGTPPSHDGGASWCVACWGRMLLLGLKPEAICLRCFAAGLGNGVSTS